MYISGEITNVSIQWTDICRHEYQRISRTKWRIDCDYKCGAKMNFIDMPDDMIQCLILGAFNSKKEMATNLGKVGVNNNAIKFPVADWKDLQSILICI